MSLNISYHLIHFSYFGQKRIFFDPFTKETDVNPQTQQIGIRVHGWLIALVLRLLGKIETVRTSTGETLYLNKNSVVKWLDRHGEQSQDSIVKRIKHVCQQSFLQDKVNSSLKNKFNIQIEDQPTILDKSYDALTLESEFIEKEESDLETCTGEPNQDGLTLGSDFVEKEESDLETCAQALNPAFQEVETIKRESEDLKKTEMDQLKLIAFLESKPALESAFIPYLPLFIEFLKTQQSIVLKLEATEWIMKLIQMTENLLVIIIENRDEYGKNSQNQKLELIVNHLNRLVALRIDHVLQEKNLLQIPEAFKFQWTALHRKILEISSIYQNKKSINESVVAGCFH